MHRLKNAKAFLAGVVACSIGMFAQCPYTDYIEQSEYKTVGPPERMNNTEWQFELPHEGDFGWAVGGDTELMFICDGKVVQTATLPPCLRQRVFTNRVSVPDAQ
jgi:hypothetical protein